MSFALECSFDLEASESINGLISILNRNSIPVDDILYPHISLAVYDSLDLASYSEKFYSFFSNSKSIQLSFTHFDTFCLNESVLFLAPEYSESLYQFHSDYHEYFKEFQDTESAYYLPKDWAPHCTVAIKLSKEMLATSIQYLHEISLPLNATIQKVSLVEFPPAKEIISCSLKN